MLEDRNRISDAAMMTYDQCGHWTIALCECERRELRQYIQDVEPAMIDAAQWTTNTAASRMVAAGLAGPLTGAICDDVMDAAFIGYALARRASRRFTHELLEMLIPETGDTKPQDPASENKQ